MNTKNVIGKTIVGYRYGEAPECGFSYNFAENCYEPGISMASVGYTPEIRSFAVCGSYHRKRCYYIGTICGDGGDGEVCLENVRRITYKDYVALKKEFKETSNAIIRDTIDSEINLINSGYHLGRDEEGVRAKYEKYIK